MAELKDSAEVKKVNSMPDTKKKILDAIKDLQAQADGHRQGLRETGKLISDLTDIADRL